jgi:hypothetical protein
MRIEIVRDQISLDQLREIAKEFYGFMIKGVVDIEEEIAAFGGEYHMDANLFLIDKGSKQPNIWGFNVYFHKKKGEEGWLEYTSLINIRPTEGNVTMEIADPLLKNKINSILQKIIKES